MVEPLATATATEILSELVHEGLENESVHASDATEHYLVSLLEKFLRTDPDRLAQTLGVALYEASLLPPAQRYTRLKGVADTTLFMAGIFLDHFEAALPTTDYYFAVGSRAYLDLGALTPAGRADLGAHSQTFTELGKRFDEFVRVLCGISDRDLFPGQDRTLAIYERWLRYNSPRDSRRLMARGIIPAKAVATQQ